MEKQIYEIKSIVTISSDDWDDLVRDYFPYAHYDGIDFELGHDLVSPEIKKEDFLNYFNLRDKLLSILKFIGGEPEPIEITDILMYFVWMEILPEGQYQIII